MLSPGEGSFRNETYLNVIFKLQFVSVRLCDLFNLFQSPTFFAVRDSQNLLFLFRDRFDWSVSEEEMPLCLYYHNCWCA
jgi:hypothetical protein